MRQRNIRTALVLLCCFSLIQATAFSSPTIRRLPAVVEKVNQVARQLKQNRSDFSKEIDRMKNGLVKFRNSYSVKDANKYTNRTLAKLNDLITHDPLTAHAERESITGIIRNTETILQSTVDQFSYVLEMEERTVKQVSELSKALTALEAAKKYGDATYLREARLVATKIQDLANTQKRFVAEESDPEIKSALNEVLGYFIGIQQTFRTTTSPRTIEREAKVLEKITKGINDQFSKRVRTTVDRHISTHNANKLLLDPENGKIAEIKQRVNTLTTEQPLTELLARTPIALNVETADTLLRNAKGYALSLAEENGLTELKLDNGSIKELLTNYLKLDEFKIENFALEDLEVYLRSFSPDEELKFVKTLGTNWRQYLFIIENSKTKDGERLLSMADLKDDEFIQDFVASFLDNLNTVVPEYEHRLPDNLFSVHKHNGNFIDVLKYSEVYSQQLGELKANNFLNKAKENFLQALEDLRQANDEEMLLELYDKPAEELAVYRQAVENELASIDKNVDNISKAYTKSLRSLYDQELNTHESALRAVSSKTDAKLASLDKQFNNQGVNARPALPEAIENYLISPNKLEDIRNITTEVVNQHERYRPGSKTRAEMRRLYAHLDWAMVNENRNHPYLIKIIFDQEFKIALPRASGDISKGVANNIFKQVRALHIAEGLSVREILSIDELRVFLQSEQYQNLSIADGFIKDALNPIRELIGIR